MTSNNKTYLSDILDDIRLLLRKKSMDTYFEKNMCLVLNILNIGAT